MRRIFQTISILCTLLLLWLGAFMPRLTALILDQQLENDVMLLKNQELSFTLEEESDFFQTLELFSNTHSQVELSEGYRMNVRDAEIAGLEARMRLTLFNTAYESPEVTPMLITSKSTPGISGIFWRCVWRKYTDVPEVSIKVSIQEVLWLDDKTGQMVSFAGRVGQSNLSDTNTLFSQTAVNVAEYCRLYYPVDTVKLALTDGNNLDGRYTVTLLKSQNGQDKLYSILMHLVDGWLYFNT